MSNKTDEIKTDILKQFNQDLQVNAKEIDHLKSQLESLINTLEVKIAEQMSALDQEIKLLKGENLFLNKVPIKIGEKLNQIIPDIAKEVTSQVFTEFNDKMRDAEDKLSKLIRKIEDSASKISDLDKSSSRKKLLTFGITVICSSAITLSVCYFGMKQFPQYMHIDHKGSLHIDHGKVSIWGYDEGKD